MDYRKYTKKNLKKNFILNFFQNLSVTSLLIISNIVLFVVFFLLLSLSSQLFNLSGQQFLENFIALKPTNILQGRALWTFLTSMFMHGGVFHLFINMFVLFSLGMVMERIVGRRRFLWFYLASGLFSGLIFVLLAALFGRGDIGASIFGGVSVPAVGASGAIFAIAGLFVVLLPRARFAIIFLPFFSLPGYIMVPGVLILTWIASVATGLPVGNSAHFGGFLAGLIYGLYLRRKYKNKIRKLNKMIA